MAFASSLLVSCSTGSNEHTVTFKQANNSDVIRKVKHNEALTDVPSPNPKTGYTVKWDTTDFTKITEDKVVNALESANQYVITYSAEGYPIHGTTVNLTYDSTCSSLDMSLTKRGFTFEGWKYNSTLYTNQSIWNVADNVTLTASWIESKKYTVTFIDVDGTNIVKTVYEGDTLTDVPTPSKKTGYKVRWDTTDFTNIRENKVVNVITEAKQYTVSFNANGGEMAQTTQVVTFDQPYTLSKPYHEENKFVSWKYNGNEVPLSGTWNIDSNDPIEFIAEWGSSEWTVIH